MDHDFLQSGEVLLEITKSEYQNEFNRASVLDTKIGITLPVIATYFFLLLQFDSVKKLFLAKTNSANMLTTLVSICIPLIFMAAVVSAAAAFIFFVPCCNNALL